MSKNLLIAESYRFRSPIIVTILEFLEVEKDFSILFDHIFNVLVAIYSFYIEIVCLFRKNVFVEAANSKRFVVLQKEKGDDCKDEER